MNPSHLSAMGLFLRFQARAIVLRDCFQILIYRSDELCRGDHRSSATTAVDFMVRDVEDVVPYS